MEQLFIPDKIKVGYQERSDTYTKRLAYVIYYDKKGVLRKEASWRGWIDKGHDGFIGWDHEKRDPSTGQALKIIDPTLIRPPLDTHDFDNVPTEGFVLNKKAGGYSSGWNHRATYCRIYDPRGFEFEISIENLLFIFQECDSQRGKGLLGEFVYSWWGKDLVLLPAHCEEYKKSRGFTDLQSKKVSAKTLIPGAVYLTKRQEDLIYLGKHSWYCLTCIPVPYEEARSYSGMDKYSYRELQESKYHVFYDKNSKMVLLNSLTSLAECKSDTIVSNYAELMDDFINNIHSSPFKSLEDEPLIIDWKDEGFNDITKYRYHNTIGNVYRKVGEGKWVRYQISEQSETRYPVKNVLKGYDRENIDYEKPQYRLLKGYYFIPQLIIEVKDGKLSTDSRFLEQYSYKVDAKNYSWHHNNYKENKLFTREEIYALNPLKLFVNLENGKRLTFENY